MTQDDQTALAVAIGVLQEGMKNALEGINDIKTSLSGVENRLGNVETKVEVVTTRQDATDEKLKEQTARKPPWTAIGAFAIGAVALLFQVLGIGQ